MISIPITGQAYEAQGEDTPDQSGPDAPRRERQDADLGRSQVC